MRRFFLMLLVVTMLALLPAAVFAASNDTVTVNYEVTAINELNIDDASVTLTVNSATAGLDPNQASDGATYDITTNCAANAKKITAAINTDMGSGLTLQINMTAPTGGSSAGAVTLSSTAVSAVTAIDAVAEADKAITFTLDATLAAGVVSSASKTCTLTLTDS
jgi:hypothetical protein